MSRFFIRETVDATGLPLMLPPKSPEATGNTPTRVEILEIQHRVRVRYDDGTTTVFLFTPEQLLKAISDAQ